MNNSISKALAGAGDSLDMDSRFEASDHSVLVLEFGFSLDLLLSLVLMGAGVMLRVVMTAVLGGLFAGSFVDSYAMLFEHLPPDISHRSPFLQHYGRSPPQHGTWPLPQPGFPTLAHSSLRWTVPSLPLTHVWVV